MTFKELCDEVVLRHLALNGQIMFQPKPVDYNVIFFDLNKAIRDVEEINNTPIGKIEDWISTIVWNLQHTIDTLEEMNTNKPISIDNAKEVWIDHEPIVMLEE